MYVLNDTFTNGFFFDSLIIATVSSVGFGIYVIITKNPVISVLFLIGLFFSIASYLMLLGLNFIGLSYLLVYVGAVSILFLFILMLINVRISELVTDNYNSFTLAISLCVLISTPILAIGNHFDVKSGVKISLLDTGYAITHGSLISDILLLKERIFSLSQSAIYYATSNSWDGSLGEASHITSLGNVIYTIYPLWLILTSIILLLAMVGAIVITIKE